MWPLSVREFVFSYCYPRTWPAPTESSVGNRSQSIAILVNACANGGGHAAIHGFNFLYRESSNNFELGVARQSRIALQVHQVQNVQAVTRVFLAGLSVNIVAVLLSNSKRKTTTLTQIYWL